MSTSLSAPPYEYSANMDEVIDALIHMAVLRRCSFEQFAKFQLQSSWDDVAAKAKRLIQSGQVTVLRNSPTHVMGHVIGDHGEYNNEIARTDPNSNVIEQWNCECPWNQYAFDRTRKWKYLEGRVCSHVLALYWKAKGTPLDMSDMDSGYQPPGGQRLGPTPGQQKMDVPNQEPVDLQHPNAPRQFSPDEQAAPTPEQATPAPSTQDITLGQPPQMPFQPAQQPQGPQYQQLQLFDITAPPGMQPVPQGSPVSIPGGRPPTPGSPVQFPGTFSHFLPIVTVYSKDFVYGSDELTSYFEQQRQQGLPVYAALTQPVTLEMRGGKIPVPGAQSIGSSSEGVPMYRVIDLGWNPETGQRENADANALMGAPELTGTYTDAPMGKHAEVIDYNPQLRMAYVSIPLNYPGGEDCRLHPHSLVGWVDYNSLRALPQRTRPVVRRRRL